MYFFKLIFIFEYVGLCCCKGFYFSLGAASRGYSLVASAQASHCRGFSCVVHRLQGLRVWRFSFRALDHRLNSQDVRAQMLCGMWDLPGPGIKPIGRHFPTYIIPPSLSASMLQSLCQEWLSFSNSYPINPQKVKLQLKWSFSTKST